MQTPSGERISTSFFGGLGCRSVLYDFDGPRIFTSSTSSGADLLVYLSEEDEDRDRFVVATTSSEIVDDLREGRIAVRSALDQAWTWVVDRAHSGEIVGAWRVPLSALAQNTLPKPGVPLLPEHRSFLAIKLFGPELTPGRVPASAVKRAVESATAALKALVDYVFEEAPQPELKPRDRRRLHDLPVLSLRFGSVEVAFTEPTPPTDSPSPDESPLAQALVLLDSGLAWVAEGETVTPPGDESRRSAVLDALSRLVPPSKGHVHGVQITGRSIRQGRPLLLTRESTELVRSAIQQMRQPPGPVSHIGLIRELDKDHLSFTLRNSAGEDICECLFMEELLPVVEAAFAINEEVTIVGRESSKRTEVEVTAIARPGRDASPGQ